MLRWRRCRRIGYSGQLALHNTASGDNRGADVHRLSGTRRIHRRTRNRCARRGNHQCSRRRRTHRPDNDERDIRSRNVYAEPDRSRQLPADCFCGGTQFGEQLVRSLGGARECFAVAVTQSVSCHRSITVGSQATLSFTFKDAFGNAESGASVSLTTNSPGASFGPNSGTTSASGTFSTQFVATTAGSSTITATVAGVAVGFTGVTIAPDPCTPVALTLPSAVSGTVTGACVLGGYAGTVYSFTVSGTSPAPVAFNVASTSFAPATVVTRNPPQSGSQINNSLGTTGTLSTDWALPAGSYEVYVLSTSGTGPFALTANTVSGNPGCVSISMNIVLSTSSTGTLASPDCQFASTVAWYYDSFAVYSTLPCTISMTSAAFTAELSLRDTSGNVQLGNFVASGVGGTAQTTLSTCAGTGTSALQIFATSSAAGATGAYTLTVTIQGQSAAADAISRRIVLRAARAISPRSPGRESSPPSPERPHSDHP